MKHKTVSFAGFVIVSLIAGILSASATGEASNPLIIGIPHSEAYPYAAMMKMGFNPERAGDVRAVMQFIFSGQVKGECYFTIDRGAFDVITGRAGNPDLTIETPFEVWVDILTGKADGQQMFMEGKYAVEGDLSLMIELFKEKDADS